MTLLQSCSLWLNLLPIFTFCITFSRSSCYIVVSHKCKEHAIRKKVRFCKCPFYSSATQLHLPPSYPLYPATLSTQLRSLPSYPLYPATLSTQLPSLPSYPLYPATLATQLPSLPSYALRSLFLCRTPLSTAHCCFSELSFFSEEKHPNNMSEIVTFKNKR